MSKRFRLLIDTNVFIPLHDGDTAVLDSALANFVRIAGIAGHQLLRHNATTIDFERDKNDARRKRNLSWQNLYQCLEAQGPCPWNTASTPENDVCDNELLWALKCDAVHALVTEDEGIHRKARRENLSTRVYTIQAAEVWLKRLHEPIRVSLPNIQDVALHQLTTRLSDIFFDSLRQGYDSFDRWFRTKAQEGRLAWCHFDEQDKLRAICIYTDQEDEVTTDDGQILSGKALKLCTFKVGELVRGQKIGELFLKASFKYATDNGHQHIFIHAKQTQEHLIRLLADFGFEKLGEYRGDEVWVKEHPSEPPTADVAAFAYCKKYFPHYRAEADIQKFIIPIQPRYHKILFPDYTPIQRMLPDPYATHVGNAIKLAYLCNSPAKSLRAGDLVLFYRTGDEKAITSIGIVEFFDSSQDAEKIASIVGRRTVYSFEQIKALAKKDTRVILFRLIKHLSKTIAYGQLKREGIVSGPIQSITKASDESFAKIVANWQ